MDANTADIYGKTLVVAVLRQFGDQAFPRSFMPSEHVAMLLIW